MFSYVFFNIQLLNFILFYTSLLILFLFVSNNLLSNTNWSEPRIITELNSKSNDFAPIYNKFDSTIYFNSQREGTSYWYITKLSSGGFEFLGKLNSPINKKGNDQSYFTFISKNKAIFNTFSIINGNLSQDLYYSYYNKRSWSDGELIKELADNNFNMQATVSGDVLVFISNKGNDINDTDLWISEMNLEGDWDKPQKLDGINSLGRELTPFLASEDTLYFSSDGFGGNRGLDIFMSVKKLDEWQRPIPLSSINSDFDDSDFTILPNGKALFASNRPNGNGLLDLYSTEMIKSNTKEKDDNELEISLNTNTDVLTLKRLLSFEYKPLNPYFYFRGSEVEFDSDYNDVNEYNLDLLRQELRKGNSITLFAFTPNISELENNSDNSKFLSDRRLEYIKSNLEGHSIDFDNLSFEYKYYDPELSNLSKIIFISSERVDYSQVRNSEVEKQIFNPDTLEFNAIARPEYLFKEFNFQLKDFNLQPLQNLVSVQLPWKFKMPINNYINNLELNSKESITFYLEAVDRKNNISNYELELKLNKIDIFEPQYKLVNGKKLQEIEMTIHDKEHLTLSKSITKFVNHVSNNSLIIDKINILSKNGISPISNEILSKIRESSDLIEVDRLGDEDLSGNTFIIQIIMK